MHLRDVGTAPPGGWKFREERTGWQGSGITPEQLFGRVAQHRANMKLPIVSPGYADLQSEVEDWICRQLPPNDRKSKCRELVRGPKPLQPGDILAAIILKITGKNGRACSKCARRIAKMNDWGWAGCVVHLKEIIGWMKEEAAERGHPMDDNAAASLFHAMWTEMKTKDELTQKQKQEDEEHAKAPVEK